MGDFMFYLFAILLSLSFSLSAMENKDNLPNQNPLPRPKLVRSSSAKNLFEQPQKDVFPLIYQADVDRLKKTVDLFERVGINPDMIKEKDTNSSPLLAAMLQLQAVTDIKLAPKNEQFSVGPSSATSSQDQKSEDLTHFVEEKKNDALKVVRIFLNAKPFPDICQKNSQKVSAYKVAKEMSEDNPRLWEAFQMIKKENKSWDGIKKQGEKNIAWSKSKKGQEELNKLSPSDKKKQ
jgi:hypothetical protein